MTTATTIEWTDHTWNPVTGCSKVSQGCKHCYAERIFARPYPGRAFTDVRCHPERLDQPLRLRTPKRIFVNSMSDLFHEDVPDGFIDKVFAVMALAPQHTFQVLTKRAERMLRYCRSDDSSNLAYEPDLDGEATRDAFIEGQAQAIYEKRHGEDPSMWLAVHQPLPNVWLGVSVEDQDRADERIPLLLQTPAAVRWISAEPLLGPLDVEQYLRIDGCHTFSDGESLPTICCECHGKGSPRLDWVVTGGESGPKARPSHPDWFRSVRDECATAGVPYLHKQNGEWAPGECASDGGPSTTERCAWLWDDDWRYGTLTPRASLETHADDAPDVYRLGKKKAGRWLDGRIHDEYPAV